MSDGKGGEKRVRGPRETGMRPGKRRMQESGAGKRVGRGTLETGRGNGWDGKRVGRETGGTGYGEPGKA